MTLKHNRTVKCKIDSSCMATTVVDNNLDDHLLSEILIRLPAKTIGRLKVVNKRWYSLASDPFFLNKHISLQTNQNVVSYFSCFANCGRITQLSFDRSPPNLLSETTISLGLPKEFEDVFGFIEVSCNGLLLINLKSCICIFNPLTKKKQFIPSPCPQFLPGLVFSPTQSSPDHHYTVVCLVTTQSMTEIKIYNSETGCWRDSKRDSRTIYADGFNYEPVCLATNPASFRGIIYWLTRRVIIAFNLVKEDIRFIEVPNSVFAMELSTLSPINWRSWFGVVEDEVNLVHVTSEHEILIWALDDYENNKWKLKKKDVIKIEMDKDSVRTKPIFFDGVRLVLLVSMKRTWESYWQEHNIQTGVSGPLCVTNEDVCFPRICTLTEVSGNNRSN